MRLRPSLTAALLLGVGLVAAPSCGRDTLDKTGDESDGGEHLDAGHTTAHDAGSGEHVDAGHAEDAGPGKHLDAGHEEDAGHEQDLDAGHEEDAGLTDGGDDIGPLPVRGGVTLDGGAVDRLYFSLTGDTRPPICDVFLTPGYDYPSAQVTEVAQQMEARLPQFGLDLGDHMFVCFGGKSEAQNQMNAYMTAIGNFTAPFFMTMGNHECLFALGGSIDDCGANDPTDPAYTTFLAALAPISSTPYYYRDIQTSMGLARFVFIADDAWDSTESDWLTSVLSEADTLAKYTIVSHHHNLAASTSGNYATIVDLIQAHKYALHLTAHTHTYEHDTTDDPSGRTVIVGVGGASDAVNPALGYATVVQGLDGRLYFTMYDSSTDLPMDAWDVGPNP
jgi:hypothetical protein